MAKNLNKYFAVTHRDRQWGLAVTTAGHQTVAPGDSYPLQNHPDLYLFQPYVGRVLDEYQLVYITGGCGWFASQHCEKVCITAGTLLLLFPGEWHSYYPDCRHGWVEYWIGLQGEQVDLLMRGKFFSPESPVYQIGVSAAIVELYENIIAVGLSENPGYRQLMSAMAMHMIGLVHYKQLNSMLNNPEEAELTSRAKALMLQMLESKTTAEQIAAKMGVGYSRFRKMFKRYTGVAPAQYRLQLKLTRAKELLTATTLSVGEIAYRLGFENTAQFSSFFHKKTGIAPSEFRNRTH